MKLNVLKYIQRDDPIGEVLSIDGNVINVYVYPEYYGSISINQFLIIVSKHFFPITVVFKNIHRTKREGSFAPSRTGYERLKEIYPDIDRTYVYAISTYLVGYSSLDGEVYISPNISPRLHDFTYVLDEDDTIALFKRNGQLDFGLLRYLLSFKQDPLFFRDFLFKNRHVLKSLSNKETIFKTVFDVIRSVITDERIMRVMLNDLVCVLEWE